MAVIITPIVPTNFDGNRYLLNEDDPMDTRDDYVGYGLVGSDQSAWVYQKIIYPCLEAMREPFEVPAWAFTWIRGREVGFAVTQLEPTQPAPPAPILSTLQSLLTIPTLSTLSTLPPPAIPTIQSLPNLPPPPQQLRLPPAPPVAPKRVWKSDFDIGSGSIRQRY